jgi:hypothetical protein
VFEWPGGWPGVEVEVTADTQRAVARAGADGNAEHRVPQELAGEVKRATVGTASGVATALAGAAAPLPDPWARMIGSSLEVDPHPSLDTLQAFVIERVKAQCEKLGGPPTDDNPRRLNADAKVSHDFATLLAHAIGAHEVGAIPKPGQKADPRPDAETWVELKWENNAVRTPSWSRRPLLKGKLVARVTGPKGSAVVSGNVDEKPWLYELPGGAGGRQYVIAVSHAPAASGGHAVQSARRNAEALLYPHVRSQLAQLPGGSRVPDSVVLEKVKWAAMVDAGVMDSCVVRVDRPYGAVYYAAQLRDVSQGQMRSVAASTLGASAERRQTFAGMIAGLGGMVLVLGVLYLALNALTRGYFRGRLRAATIVVALVAGAAVLVLMA